MTNCGASWSARFSTAPSGSSIASRIVTPRPPLVASAAAAATVRAVAVDGLEELDVGRPARVVLPDLQRLADAVALLLRHDVDDGRHDEEDVARLVARAR